MTSYLKQLFSSCPSCQMPKSELLKRLETNVRGEVSKLVEQIPPPYEMSATAFEAQLAKVDSDSEKLKLIAQRLDQVRAFEVSLHRIRNEYFEYLPSRMHNDAYEGRSATFVDKLPIRASSFDYQLLREAGFNVWCHPIKNEGHVNWD